MRVVSDIVKKRRFELLGRLVSDAFVPCERRLELTVGRPARKPLYRLTKYVIRAIDGLGFVPATEDGDGDGDGDSDSDGEEGAGTAVGCRFETVDARLSRLRSSAAAHDDVLLFTDAKMETSISLGAWVERLLADEGLAELWDRCPPELTGDLTKSAPYRVPRRDVVATIVELVREFRRSRTKGVVTHARMIRNRSAEYHDEAVQLLMHHKTYSTQLPRYSTQRRRMPSDEVVQRLVRDRVRHLAKVTPDDIIAARKLEQRSKAWAAQRLRGRVSSTMVAAVMDRSEFGDAEDLLGDLGWDLDEQAKGFCAHGIESEPKALRALLAVGAEGDVPWARGTVRCDGISLHSQAPMVAASPDATIETGDGGRWLVEIKAPARKRLRTLTVEDLRRRRQLKTGSKPFVIHWWENAPDGDGLQRSKRIEHHVARNHWFQAQVAAYLSGASKILLVTYVPAATPAGSAIEELTDRSHADRSGQLYLTPHGTIKIIEMAVEREYLEHHVLPRCNRFAQTRLIPHVVRRELGMFRHKGETADQVQQFVDVMGGDAENSPEAEELYLPRAPGRFKFLPNFSLQPFYTE